MLSKKKLLWISCTLLILIIGIFTYNQQKYLIKKTTFNISFEPKQKKEINLIIGGDIMLSRGIGRRAKNKGYEHSFSDYHPIKQFSGLNTEKTLLIFNLESPFSTKDNDQPKGGFLFRANTGNIATLKILKDDYKLLLSIANNHTSNAGGAGIRLTRKVLNQAKIGFAGAGNSTEEAQKIRSQKINDIIICFQAYSYDGNFNNYRKTPLAWNKLELKGMTDDLKKMEKMGCHLKIINLHRGREYRRSPLAFQREIAHQLINANADIVIGGHSHIPGEWEIYKGKPIFYSMGNFLFDQDRGMKAQEKKYDYIWDAKLKRQTVPTYISLLAQLQVEKTQTGITISTPRFTMSRVEKGKFYPLDKETSAGIIEKISPKANF